MLFAILVMALASVNGALDFEHVQAGTASRWISRLFGKDAGATRDVETPATKMECGSGVSLCGILTMETGLGCGYYKHDEPSPHGLWPETGNYGSSGCIAPGDNAKPTTLFPCYVDPAVGNGHQLDFEQHEWSVHGQCAGVKDATDFFTQVCDLAKGPTAIMKDTRFVEKETDVSKFSADLAKAGYPVFYTDSANGQVMLSACAGPDRVWKLAPVEQFASVCGGWKTTVAPPSPSPGPAGTTCIKNTHGPPCSSDADCEGLPGCVRCAHSGFCTTVPLA